LAIDGDDLWRLRLAAGSTRPPSRGDASGGTPAFLGKVTTAAPAVGKFFLVDPVLALGPEVEGGTPSFTVSVPGAGIAVYLLGPAVPVTGDYLICRHVDHRWVAERGLGTGSGGGAVGHIPNCFCDPIPATLTMTSADPTCNYRMFQSCTIQYGPTPAEYAALNLPPNTFLSVQSFADPLSGGASFRYYLTCQYTQFNLSRVYVTSPFGSPYRDGVLYSWVLNGTSNICSPFRLDAGSAYPGSDASCGVTIDGP
jgi:hypothetical protein